MNNRLSRSLVLILAFLGLAIYPHDALACSSVYGIDDLLTPWTPIQEADCSVTGYAVNWLGVVTLAAISIIGFGVMKYAKRHKRELFG